MLTSVEIADAVVVELNAGNFSQEVTAVRKALPSYELKELSKLTITVVPKALDITTVTRSESQYEYQIDIGIHKKIKDDLEVEVEQNIALVEEIADYIKGRKLSQAADVVWVKIQNIPIYGLNELTEKRLFASLITVTYKTMK